MMTQFKFKRDIVQKKINVNEYINNKNFLQIAYKFRVLIDFFNMINFITKNNIIYIFIEILFIK